jgi:hypothetical protein
VNQALTALGLLEQGGTPSVSDSADALLELNQMWDGWAVDEDLIYAIQDLTFAWAANTASYPIGPGAGAPFNVPVPQKIYEAHWLDSLGVRANLKVVDITEYSNHGDLAATAKRPDELYADWNIAPATGSMTLNLYPVSSLAGTLEIHAPATFSAFVMATAYYLAYSLQDAIVYALAWRLIPRFGVAVVQQTVEMIEELAMKAEQRYGKAVAQHRLKPEPVAPPEPAPPPAPGGQQ